MEFDQKQTAIRAINKPPWMEGWMNGFISTDFACRQNWFKSIYNCVGVFSYETKYTLKANEKKTVSVPWQKKNTIRKNHFGIQNKQIFWMTSVDSYYWNFDDDRVNIVT